MAKVGQKVEALRVSTVGKQITFHHDKRNAAGDMVVDSEYVVNFGDVHPEMQVKLALYGYNKWLQDRTSQFREFGIKATLEAMQEYVELARDNLWNKPRSGGTASAPKADRVAVFCALFAEEKGAPIAKVSAMFAAAPAQKQKELLAAYAERISAALAESAEGGEEDFFDL